MKKLFLTILALAVAGGAFWISLYLTRDSDTDAMPWGNMTPVNVAVMEAHRMPMSEIFEYAGSVEATESVAIVPKVTGIVEEILVDLGDKVAQGDPLVTIDDDAFAQRLKQARANLQLAQAQLERSRIARELAALEFERVQRLNEQGLSTSQDEDSAAAARASALVNVTVAEAEIARMQAALDEARINVENTRIVSPLDGYVESRNVDPGALASPSMVLLRLVNTDPAKVVVHIPESDIMLAEIGREAVVKVAGGALEVRGRVARVSPSLNILTRTTLIEINVPNAEGKLRPGMSADIAIIGREDSAALAVPEEALVLMGTQLSAYVVDDGVAHIVPVETGIQQGRMIQITRGLDEGDLVIVKGQFLVKSGAKVDARAVPFPVSDS